MTRPVVELSVSFPTKVDLSVQNNDQPIPLGVAETFQGSNDYNALFNKPKLDGVTIQGDMREKDPTVPAWAKTPERPAYNADDVGALDKNKVTSISISSLQGIWNSI